MTSILALDLGTKMGWAMSGDPLLHGVVDLKGGRHEGGGMRYLRFRKWLEEVLEIVDVVVYEEVRRHAGTDAAHVYGGLLAILTTQCEKLNIPYTGVPVGTVKKHATGRGNASKSEMIAAAREGGCRTDDDNEADAWAILQWGIANLGDSKPAGVS